MSDTSSPTPGNPPIEEQHETQNSHNDAAPPSPLSAGSVSPAPSHVSGLSGGAIFSAPSEASTQPSPAPSENSGSDVSLLDGAVLANDMIVFQGMTTAEIAAWAINLENQLDGIEQGGHLLAAGEPAAPAVDEMEETTPAAQPATPGIPVALELNTVLANMPLNCRFRYQTDETFEVLGLENTTQHSARHRLTILSDHSADPILHPQTKVTIWDGDDQIVTSEVEGCTCAECATVSGQAPESASSSSSLWLKILGFLVCGFVSRHLFALANLYYAELEGHWLELGVDMAGLGVLMFLLWLVHGFLLLQEVYRRGVPGYVRNLGLAMGRRLRGAFV